LILSLGFLCLSQKAAAGTHEKPEVVKTHLRDMIVTPDMIGSVVGVYNGKVFNSVEIKVGKRKKKKEKKRRSEKKNEQCLSVWLLLTNNSLMCSLK
jgi:ribosomal protein S19